MAIRREGPLENDGEYGDTSGLDCVVETGVHHLEAGHPADLGLTARFRPLAPVGRRRLAAAPDRECQAAVRLRVLSQRGLIQVARVDLSFVAVWVEDEQGSPSERFLTLDRSPRPVLRPAELLDDFVERLLGDGKGEVHRTSGLMSPRGVCDLNHEVATLTLKVRALLITLIERNPELVMVEVDRPVEVLNFQEDLFNSNEPHIMPPPMPRSDPAAGADSLEQLRHVIAVEQLSLLRWKADPDRRIPAEHLEGAEL